MIALWLIIGYILVSVAYFLPGQSVDLWPNLNAAGLALLAYLAVLLVAFLRRKDLSRRTRLIVTSVSLLVIAASAFSWTQLERQSRWQRQLLGEVGSVIGRGIYTSMVVDTLLSVLDDYHQQPRNGKGTLGSLYKRRFPPGNVGDSWSTIAMTGRPEPPDDVFLTELSDTHVVLIARHPWYRGTDREFKTFKGPVGTLQVRATLTGKGLQYVTEN